MKFYFTPFIIPLIASTLVLLWIAIYAWKRRFLPIARDLFHLMIVAMFFSIINVLQISAVDLDVKMPLLVAVHLCVALSVIFGTILIFRYAKLDQFITPKIISLLSNSPNFGPNSVLD